MRRVAWGYLAFIIPIIPILPIMAADYVVSLPLLMVYMLGMGPVFAIIREPATCVDCGAFLPRPSRELRSQLALAAPLAPDGPGPRPALSPGPASPSRPDRSGPR